MASSRPSKRRRKGKPKTKESPSTLTQDNASRLVVFAHGAGAPSSSDWMIRYVWGKRKVSTKAQTDTRDPQMQMSQIF
ncbi:hypothetical protein Gotur_028218 [Gossypium turneri]